MHLYAEHIIYDPALESLDMRNNEFTCIIPNKNPSMLDLIGAPWSEFDVRLRKEVEGDFRFIM